MVLGKADKEKLVSLLDGNNEQRVSFRSTMSEKSEDVISDIWKVCLNYFFLMFTKFCFKIWSQIT